MLEEERERASRVLNLAQETESAAITAILEAAVKQHQQDVANGEEVKTTGDEVKV